MEDIELKFRIKHIAIFSFAVIAIAVIARYYILVPPVSEPNEHTHTPVTTPSSNKYIFNPPEAASAFSLTDQFGQRKGLSDWNDKIVLVSYIYTRCPLVCQVLAVNFVNIHEQLGEELSDRVVFVFVTVDPEYDTPEILAAWTDAYKGSWVALTGTPEELEDIWHAYNVVVFEADGEIGHTGKATLIDQNGFLVYEYYYPLDIDPIINDIQALTEQ